MTLRPVQRLQIDNNYTWERLRNQQAAQSAFNNHIFRTKANYQITRALSLRFIETYETLLTNPLQSTLQTTKGFNTDFLVTYLLHPGTAFYVGYNSNLANLTPNLAADPNGNQLRTRDTFINDERQFFIKISYLFRF
jgi:predicted porin